MGRTPDGLSKRDVVTSFRLEPAEVDQMDRQRTMRGMTRSRYLRWLVQEDGRKIRSEGG
jgi:hypothetical protein